jgi:acid phosphatase family membrane protein YuiD
MPDDRDAAAEYAGLELAEAIIRVEFQVVLLCAAVAIRAGAGRDCAGLNGLIASGDRRLAEMEAEQRELLVAGR